MWLLSKDTEILVCKPKNYFDTRPWKPMNTTKDTLLQKENVFDFVSFYNDSSDIPEWIAHAIKTGYTVFHEINSKGKKVYGMTKAKNLIYMD